MSTKNSFTWVLLVGVLGAVGCGPVAIRALTPASDGSVDTDSSTPTDVQIPPGRCLSNDQCDAGQYCAGDGCGTLGTCAARPSACPAIYGPVCGCDGRTYGNSCEAAAGGARVASQGECATPVDAGVDAGPGRCQSNDQCGGGQYCAGEGCGTPGTCVARPEACTREYAPVCGCDGRTYGNACGAASAGVRVSYRGACGSVPDAGVTCVTARDCGAGNTCVYPESACARSGSCQPETPCFRAETFCACTGETYEACVPDRSTRSRGPCAAVDAGVDAGPARCLSNDQCDRAHYCAGTGCGTPGTCAVRPQACPEIYSPVCGCDGRTYGNSCEAAGNGARVASTGQCPTPTDAGVDAGTARCTSNDQCGRGQYCAGEGCGTAGACVARPQACTLEYAPVCGCDGRTYGNACGAASAGMRVSYRGECGSAPDAGAGCVTSRDCGARETCVYPDSACVRAGSCQPTIQCLRAETFCACTGETYQGCVPDRPTRSRGPCASEDAGASRCAAVLCGPGTTCCEATGACYDLRCLDCCPTPPPRDAGAPGCASNADCADREYCAAPSCGARGVCATRPQACTALYAPVCGCDRRTYSNACVANGQGVNVASQGVCP